MTSSLHAVATLLPATRRDRHSPNTVTATHNDVFTSKIPHALKISSSHQACGIPAGVRSVPRWQVGGLWRCRSLRPPRHEESQLANLPYREGLILRNAALFSDLSAARRSSLVDYRGPIALTLRVGVALCGSA